MMVCSQWVFALTYQYSIQKQPLNKKNLQESKLAKYGETSLHGDPVSRLPPGKAVPGNYGRHPNLLQAGFGFWGWAGLGQVVCCHDLSGGVLKQDLHVYHSIMCSVVDDVNVLSGLGGGPILDDCKWGLVINQNGDRTQGKSVVSQYLPPPECICYRTTYSISHSTGGFHTILEAPI
jgi:hypothetical protein